MWEVKAAALGITIYIKLKISMTTLSYDNALNICQNKLINHAQSNFNQAKLKCRMQFVRIY